MPDIKKQPVIRPSVSRFVAVACFVFVFALMTTGSATADEIEPSGSEVEAVATTAAADGAGWLVFEGHRSERSENLAPSAVGLAQVSEPNAPHISASDRLSHQSEIQSAQSVQ